MAAAMARSTPNAFCGTLRLYRQLRGGLGVGGMAKLEVFFDQVNRHRPNANHIVLQQSIAM